MKKELMILMFLSLGIFLINFVLAENNRTESNTIENSTTIILENTNTTQPFGSLEIVGTTDGKNTTENIFIISEGIVEDEDEINFFLSKKCQNGIKKGLKNMLKMCLEIPKGKSYERTS